MVPIGLAEALHGTKTMTAHMNVVLMASARDCMGMIVHLTAPKQSRDRRQASVHCSTTKKLHTPEHQPLPPPPMFHSTPIAVPHRLSSDPTSAHLSFAQS